MKNNYVTLIVLLNIKGTLTLKLKSLVILALETTPPKTQPIAPQQHLR